MDYKIANTTKKERAEIVKEALGISIIGNGTVPSEKAIEYIKEYIEGETELEDVQKKILNMYKNN